MKFIFSFLQIFQAKNACLLYRLETFGNNEDISYSLPWYFIKIIFLSEDYDFNTIFVNHLKLDPSYKFTYFELLNNMIIDKFKKIFNKGTYTDIFLILHNMIHRNMEMISTDIKKNEQIIFNDLISVSNMNNIILNESLCLCYIINYLRVLQLKDFLYLDDFITLLRSTCNLAQGFYFKLDSSENPEYINHNDVFLVNDNYSYSIRKKSCNGRKIYFNINILDYFVLFLNSKIQKFCYHVKNKTDNKICLNEIFCEKFKKYCNKISLKFNNKIIEKVDLILKSNITKFFHKKNCKCIININRETKTQLSNMLLTHYSFLWSNDPKLVDFCCEFTIENLNIIYTSVNNSISSFIYSSDKKNKIYIFKTN